MGEMSQRHRKSRIFHFVFSLVLPRLITFKLYEQDEIFEMIERELVLNFLIKSKKGSFSELATRAKELKILYQSLSDEELAYFPHTNQIDGEYAVRLFPFSPGEEKSAERQMQFLGYRHGTGCELVQLAFEKRKIRIKNGAIIAKGTAAKPERNEHISPKLAVGGDKKLYLNIHDHGVYGSPTQLYYLGVFVPKKRRSVNSNIQRYVDFIDSLLSGLSKSDKDMIIKKISRK
jgi:hypothetical protein